MTEIKKICKSLFEMESSLSLFDLRIHGIEIWKVIRHPLFLEIIKQKDLNNSPHFIQSKRKKMYTIPNKIYNSFFRNPLIGNYSISNIVFESPRKKLFNGEFIDIYTYDVLNKLQSSNVEIIDSAFKDKYISKDKKNRKYLDYIYLNSLISQKISNKKNFVLPADIEKKIALIEFELNVSLKVEIDLKKFLKPHLIKYMANYKLYYKLFERRKPKKIYIVCSYGKEALIQAAKDNMCEVIEVQHGVISPYHLGYNFPRNVRINSFPDKVILWGDYWKDVVNFPIDGNHLIVQRNTYLYGQFNECRTIKKNENQVIVLSQGTIGEKLSELMYEVIKNLPSFQFIYKLHPSEFGDELTVYPFLEKMKTLENCRLVGDSQSLHNLLAKSKYQIGVNSTAIYEGIELGCKTVIVDLPGHEHLEEVYNKKLAKLVKNKEEITIELRKESNYKSVNKGYFFK
ncbi:hypothetical protein [Jeotgalibacillus malaysiensis]|uniref:hypothetical protein n=1 Tax=Jeotgalibacillus malaysiensis TaxID=1508404 RepID=UPI00384E0318